MYTPEKTSTVVIVGRWNEFILTPPWVAKHVFELPKIKSEFTWSRAGIGVRLIGELAEIVSSSDRVVIFALRTDGESNRRIEELGRRLLEKLPHTPIGGIGINHAFVESADTPGVAELLDVPEHDKLTAELPLESFEIGRRLAADGYKVNIKLSKQTRADEVRFDFNFDYSGANLENPVACLTEGIVQEHFDFAVELLGTSCNLSLEEQPEEGSDESEDGQ